MTFRPAPVTQRDGSPLQNSNCLMAVAASGLAGHTRNGKTSTGALMRDYSGDTSGGTNSDEVLRAWDRGYEEEARMRDGRTWADAREELLEGRGVMLQVWHATMGGPCLSGSGSYGHGIHVGPERHSDGERWIVSDPWCKPPKWVWWPEDKLKRGAEEWAHRCAREAAGPGNPTPDIRDIPPGVLRAIVKELMGRWHPGRPAPYEPPLGVGGGGGILYTSTGPYGREEAHDVGINTNGSDLSTTRKVRMTADAGFYADALLTEYLGELAEGTERSLIGPALGSDAMAILVWTTKPYKDGVKRPTIVYVIKSKCSEPIDVEPPEPELPPDVAEAITARDAEWRAWLEADTDAPDIAAAVASGDTVPGA